MIIENVLVQRPSIQKIFRAQGAAQWTSCHEQTTINARYEQRLYYCLRSAFSGHPFLANVPRKDSLFYSQQVKSKNKHQVNLTSTGTETPHPY